MAESSTQNINPETREHSPLDKIISETQKPNQQLDRWSQGCQAIFAGFVASAHLQNLRPSIRCFGDTPQLEMIRSTLACIPDVEDKALRLTVEDWVGTLYHVLKRDDNMYTKPSTLLGQAIQHPITSSELSTVAPIRPTQLISPIDTVKTLSSNDEKKGEREGDIEWELTSRGKKLFNIRQDGRVAIPQEGVPKWWNM